jgi:hypothetical protein
LKLTDKFDYQTLLEVTVLFEKYVEIDPKMAGTPHPEYQDLWVFQTPEALYRLPKIVIVYSIEPSDGFVTLWNIFTI